MIARFREEVYENFTRRQDAGLDLLDALTSAEQVESPVAMSESPLFRREFGSIYDTLNKSEMDKTGLKETLAGIAPVDAQIIAGYEVHATDCTVSTSSTQATITRKQRRWLTAPRVAKAKWGRCR